MKYKILLIFIAGFSFILNSCKEDDDSDRIAMENRIFEAYLENNNIIAEPTGSGLYYIEEEEGEGISPSVGDWVVIKYDLTLINGEVLIYSSDRDKSIDYGIYDERIIYGSSRMQVGNNLEGLDEGLQLMKEGGKATLLLKSDLAYGSTGSGIIGPYSSLRIDIEMDKVIDDPLAYEEEMLNNYLTANNYTNIDTTSTGLYYIEIEEGTGDATTSNSYVTINVDGYLLDGRQFLDEEIFRFQVGVYDYVVTEGLNEGVTLMKELGKAKIIVPYYLGYGEAGKAYYDGKAKVPISPYSTLIYDVELIKAK